MVLICLNEWFIHQYIDGSPFSHWWPFPLPGLDEKSFGRRGNQELTQHSWGYLLQHHMEDTVLLTLPCGALSGCYGRFCPGTFQKTPWNSIAKEETTGKMTRHFWQEGVAAPQSLHFPSILDFFNSFLAVFSQSTISQFPRGLMSCPNTVFIKDFPRGSEGKASAYNAGDLGSIPGSGRSPGEGNGNALQYSCLGNPMDRGAW